VERETRGNEIGVVTGNVWDEAQRGYNLEKVSKTGSEKDGNSPGEGTGKEEAVAHETQASHTQKTNPGIAHETGQEALPKQGGSEVIAREGHSKPRGIGHKPGREHHQKRGARRGRRERVALTRIQ